MTEYEFVESKLKELEWDVKKDDSKIVLSCNLPSTRTFVYTQECTENLIKSLVESFLNFNQNNYILEKIDEERKNGKIPNVYYISEDASYLKRIMEDIYKYLSVVEYRITISKDTTGYILYQNTFYWEITKTTMGKTYICGRGSADSISEAAQKAEVEYKKLVK